MTGSTIRRPCAFCGIHPDNVAGIRIFAYTLLRSVYVPSRPGRTRTRSFGSISVCDRCIAERKRGATMHTAGFRREAMT